MGAPNSHVYKFAHYIAEGQETFDGGGGASWIVEVDTGFGLRQVTAPAVIAEGAAAGLLNVVLNVEMNVAPGRFRIHAIDPTTGLAYTGALTVRWSCLVG